MYTRPLDRTGPSLNPSSTAATSDKDNTTRLPVADRLYAYASFSGKTTRLARQFAKFYYVTWKHFECILHIDLGPCCQAARNRRDIDARTEATFLMQATWV